MDVLVPGLKTKIPAPSSSLTAVEGGGKSRSLVRRDDPPRARPLTWARDPAMSSGASRLSNDRLAGEGHRRPPRAPRGDPPRASRTSSAPSAVLCARALVGRPRLYAETPEPHEAFCVLVVELVARVIGGQVVLVERRRGSACRSRCSFRELVAPDGVAPGASARRTSPVTYLWVELKKASRASLSGENHSPSYTSSAHRISRRSFSWATSRSRVTSSRSRCASSSAIAAGHS